MKTLKTLKSAKLNDSGYQCKRGGIDLIFMVSENAFGHSSHMALKE